MTAVAYIAAAFEDLDANQGNNVWTSFRETDSTSDPNSTKFAMIRLSALLSRGRLVWNDLGGPTQTTIRRAMVVLYNHVQKKLSSNGTGAGTTMNSITQNSNLYLMNAVSRV